MTEHRALFGEWKFNYAKINLSGRTDINHYGINSAVTLNHFAFGYHF